MTRRQHGFTLVELNLAMIFVAILVLGVAYTAMNISKIYQKGITLKTVNQVGREINDQMRRDIESGNVKQMKFVQNNGVGRLCLGAVSYVYNDVKQLNAPTADAIKTSASGTPLIHFVRIQDVAQDWCRTLPAGDFVKKQLTTEKFSEYLSDNTTDLAVYALAFVPVITDDVNGGLVTLDITLGTNSTAAIVGGVCRPPSDNQADFTNCAVRQFSTVVRMGGSS